MCLDKVTKEEFVTDKDIKVWKVIYWRDKWRTGMLYGRNITEPTMLAFRKTIHVYKICYPKPAMKPFSYRSGFHSFGSKRNAEKYKSSYEEKVVRCIIPKGSRVTIGEQELNKYLYPCAKPARTYVSDKLIFNMDDLKEKP